MAQGVKWQTAKQRETAKTESRRKYKAKSVRGVLLQFNKSADADILEWLDSQPSKLQYVRRLVREDIRRKL